MRVWIGELVILRPLPGNPRAASVSGDRHAVGGRRSLGRAVSDLSLVGRVEGAVEPTEEVPKGFGKADAVLTSHLRGDAMDVAGTRGDIDTWVDNSGPALGPQGAVGLHEHERGLHDPGVERIDTRRLEVQGGDHSFMPGAHLARPFGWPVAHNHRLRPFRISSHGVLTTYWQRRRTAASRRRRPRT